MLCVCVCVRACVRVCVRVCVHREHRNEGPIRRELRTTSTTPLKVFKPEVGQNIGFQT